jgi:CheY-like chemotaxis protein
MSKEKVIILVDDDEDMLEQLSYVLHAAGYSVRTAASAADAEQLLLSVRPDLAILDLMMENMDSGIVLCHTLKKLYPGLPVILLTAVTSATGLDLKPGNAEAQNWLLADAILDKPARPEEIRATVSRLLGETAEAAPEHAH